MPLAIDKNLPSINIRFGSTQNRSEIIFTSHIDSCTAMNIQLKCAVEDHENMKDTYGKLTSLVVYNTNYFHPNSTKIIQI